VLVSLSTARANTRLEQPKAQAILDALADLGCLAELTGPALDTDRLRVPGNATVHGHRPHGQVMSDVSLTITHGGHGTVCTSLAHGVPLLCLPNPVADQPYLASRITSLGAGLGLSHDAGPDQIRSATESILHDPRYTQAAARLQAAILATPGVPGAASTLESLSSRAPRPRCAR
jgi:UDP:flavonoid glycosyltransferase YjiC (YdhE family)